MCSLCVDRPSEQTVRSNSLVRAQILPKPGGLVCDAGPVRIALGTRLGTVALAGALAGFGVAAPAAAAADPDAASLYRDALASTMSWTVHYVSDGTVSHVSILESGDAGPAAGVQQVLVRSHGSVTDNASLVVYGSTTYVKANAQALVDLTGLSATRAASSAGHWVQFATDNRAFAQVVDGVRSHDVAVELAMLGPYSSGRSRTIDGYRVDAIDGTQRFPELKPMRTILRARQRSP